ncbi:hypothetical protein MJ581_08220 [Escherichia coli]|nr:hypothetical protein MJ581_08220 [Escherichia coli]
MYWECATACSLPCARYGGAYRHGVVSRKVGRQVDISEKWARRFAVDFVGGDPKLCRAKGDEPVITLSVGSEANRNSLY